MLLRLALSSSKCLSGTWAGSEKSERKGSGPQGFSSEVGSVRLELSLPGWFSPLSIIVKLMSPESLLAGQGNCCGPRET